jgi:hypothetical protein
VSEVKEIAATLVGERGFQRGRGSGDLRPDEEIL